MPRYFFNFRDGRTELDSTGTELPDVDAARREAVKVSGELLEDGAEGSLWDGKPWQLWVCDEDGQTLFTLTFSASEN